MCILCHWQTPHPLQRYVAGLPVTPSKPSAHGLSLHRPSFPYSTSPPTGTLFVCVCVCEKEFEREAYRRSKHPPFSVNLSVCPSMKGGEIQQCHPYPTSVHPLPSPESSLPGVNGSSPGARWLCVLKGLKLYTSYKLNITGVNRMGSASHLQAFTVEDIGKNLSLCLCGSYLLE